MQAFQTLGVDFRSTVSETDNGHTKKCASRYGTFRTAIDEWRTDFAFVLREECGFWLVQADRMAHFLKPRSVSNYQLSMKGKQATG